MNRSVYRNVPKRTEITEANPQTVVFVPKRTERVYIPFGFRFKKGFGTRRFEFLRFLRRIEMGSKKVKTGMIRFVGKFDWGFQSA
jgi:hypothetical protein